MLGFNFDRRPAPPPVPDALVVDGHRVALLLVRHHRARRYLLRLRPDGVARLTIPSRGSVGTGLEFLQRNLPWLAQQLNRQQSQPRPASTWSLGTEILFRGEPVRLEGAAPGLVRVGLEQVRVANRAGDLRPAVETHLRQLAARELPARLQELAALHGVEVRRITIRSQRTRWGSCSRRGTISLNWRLIQTPGFVRDYICLHELAHRLELNHSDRFWRQVERMCPDFRTAERWLKNHPGLLG